MRRILGLGIAALVTGAGLMAFAAPAHAVRATLPAGATVVESACNPGWYVNEDEPKRIPQQVEKGLKFEPGDLVHHATDIPLAALKPGTYGASPKVTQPSFFSVEVRNSAGAYGTLRWVSADHEWSITIGAGNDATAGQFHGPNPVELLKDKVTKWGAFNAADIRVVSFGVGFTASPAGDQTVVVRYVKFNGAKYLLDCPAKPNPQDTKPDNAGTIKVDCTGIYTRTDGETKYTVRWNAQDRKWEQVPHHKAPGEWVKTDRQLTAEQKAELNCEPETPPTQGEGSGGNEISPSPTTPADSPGPDASQSPEPDFVVPVDNEPTRKALPTTGSNLLPAGLVGGGLVLGGAALFGVAWRRRKRFAVVDEHI